jgi:WhiB family transcriptional regulator, redox-sensing transcriptional regulator
MSADAPEPQFGEGQERLQYSPAVTVTSGRNHPSTDDDHWRERAACLGIDPRVFYPADDDEAEQARAICEACAVRVECLEYALARREKDGVWGGATERDRRRIIRQRRRAARLAQAS